ncbi:multidrug effflux MFS transporter [Brevirhabdus sp.]|uniref:multidrug effflux MFS transporter n=1 Tax=Brevirhabdus sp. TaxID=2004514 RepID=UPI00405860D4
MAGGSSAAAPNTARAPVQSQREFVALIAFVFASVAFSIDAMLPAISDMAQALTPQAPNRAQLIITMFLLGMGVGTLFTGPLSDSFGRKPVIYAGLALYTLGAMVAWMAPTLEMMLLGRALQGLGASGPRVVALAIVRDRYSGRAMARIVSLVMMIFTLIPVVAPSIGAMMIALFGWRGVFAAFVLFALVLAVWVWARQPETLPRDQRRPLRLNPLWRALCEVLLHRQVMLTVLVQSLAFGVLFSVLASSAQVFDVTFDRAASFPLWFGGIALVAGSASLLNAALVERVGMRFLINATLRGHVLLSGAMLMGFAFGLLPPGWQFPAWILWQTSVFFMAGLTIGNLNALAMEPMGHIAGMAASVVGAISTVLAMLIAIPIGLSFDGTPVPLIIGAFACVLLGALLMTMVRREPPDTAPGG